MTETIRAIAILKAQPGKGQELVQFTIDCLPQVRSAEGLARVEMSRVAGDPDRLFLYYWWQSIGHSERYMAGPIYQKIAPGLMDLIEDHLLLVGEHVDA
ncbi:putative quinol monooxygenase [Paraburkholderia sp.]|uniref:putative quinol monooxygenase n=1 Tax=Paraburkholderia sp. TaxID=1926495 RepID=UPI003D6FFE7B